MGAPQSSFDQKATQDVIDVVEAELVSIVENYMAVTATELLAYFDGPAPSGDETTLEDVLNNRWLLVHELVEISELKKMGLRISAQLLWDHEEEVDLAHMTATEYELQLAHQAGDNNWVSRRLQGVYGWMQDESTVEVLKERCRQLLSRFSEL